MEFTGTSETGIEKWNGMGYKTETNGAETVSFLNATVHTYMMPIKQRDLP